MRFPHLPRPTLRSASRSTSHSTPPSPATPILAVVTGSTSGIGAATATALRELGPHIHVLGTSRRAPTPTPTPTSVPTSFLADASSAPAITLLPLDLDDPASVDACAELILAALAELEERSAATPGLWLVNNAGESQSGPFEELPREALERLFRINVLSHVQLTQRLLPAMRRLAAAGGPCRVVMVGSMLASFPLSFRSSYVASKAAIKGFALAARGELSPFGVEVCVVEPGAINTGLSQRRTMYGQEDGPFAAACATMLRRLNANEASGASAESVAALILRALTDPTPRPLWATGSRARLVFPLRRVLPLGAVLRMTNRAHGLRS